MTQKNDANRPTTKQKSPKEVQPIPQSRLRFMSFSVGIGTSVFSAPSDTPTFASMRTACCPFPPTPSIVASPILKESASAAETVSSFSRSTVSCHPFKCANLCACSRLMPWKYAASSSRRLRGACTVTARFPLGCSTNVFVDSIARLLSFTIRQHYSLFNDYSQYRGYFIR